MTNGHRIPDLYFFPNFPVIFDRMIRLRTIAVACLSIVSAGVADDKAAFFEEHVRPLLLDRCSKCHDGSPEARSEFSVLSRATLMEGGDFGPAIAPGKAEESLVIQAMRHTHKELHMPPKGKGRLTPDEISIFVKWINEGAVWPGDTPRKELTHAKKDTGPKIPFDPEEDWSLLPRQVVSPPQSNDPRWNQNEIDRFVAAERENSGLQANGRADRRTLIRRATFDLTGLPPLQKDVDNFLGDPDQDHVAFRKVVDRLLGSPAYGQRAARLWLDVARYADTQGDVGDYPIPTAYLYRNWVVDSFNRDLPFDQFLMAQLAGDILATEAEDETLARELTIATGFISLSRRFGNSKKDNIHLTIEDTLDTLGRGVLGMTLRCARCHDHKFDPVSNEDYYALYGIFESTIYPWMGMSVEKSPSDLSPAIPKPESRKKVTEFFDLITHYEYQINNHFRPWLKPTLDEYKDVCGEMDRLTKASVKDELEMAALEEKRDELLEFRGGKFRELMKHGLKWVKDEKTRLAKDPGMELIFAVGEGKPGDTKLHRRGNPEQTGDLVPRGFIGAIQGAEKPPIDSGSGRLELAQWLTDPQHPLTARVFVNRIWQQHFGQGLVNTPDNFGRQGSQPSHPELLDWLAENFINNGWSVKELHRRILVTESYQLASLGENPEAETKDPTNIYLWKYPRRRLDAESIRDSMLAVSGELDKSQPQGHDIPPWYNKRYGLNGPFHQQIETNHRSVYLLTQRIYRHSQLGLFDAPDRNTSTSSRTSSNVPAQALFLMNSDFVKERAEALASRIQKVASNDDGRIEALYSLALNRTPEEAERIQIVQFIESYRRSAAKEKNEWVGLSRAILTGNEFFFFE